jgi:hypothetical protein
LVSWGLAGDSDVSLVGGSDPATSYLSILTDHGYAKTYTMDAYYTFGTQTTVNVKVIVCTFETFWLNPGLVPTIYSYLGMLNAGATHQVTEASLQSWFVCNPGALSSTKCCFWRQALLDSAMNSWTDARVSLDSSTKNLVIDLNQGLPLSVLYFQYTTGSLVVR